MKKRSKIIISLTSVAFILILIGVSVGPIMSLVETPKYVVLEKYENIEIRKYEPMVVARVVIEGDSNEVVSKGFRILADYIFGNNSTSQEISMTAPVQQQESEKIDMTAPVRQTGEGKDWIIEFVMPSEYTLDTLPKPNDSHIELLELPERKTVAIRFSGRQTEAAKHRYKLLLDDFISDSNLNVEETPTYSYYNPPWTLPIFRRNEISYVIKE